MKIILGHQSYEAKSKASTGQKLVNLYAEMNPEGSKYPFTLYNTNGLSTWIDLGTFKTIQGMQKMGDFLYAVSGNQVFKISSTGVAVNIGSITGIEERVDIANNGTQMVILNNDGAAWIATTASVVQITDPDFIVATSVAFLDGYHIFSKINSGQFNISALYDASSYDALDFATAEETPDNLVRVTAFNSALWLFGTESYEVFYNSGNADFPFEQISGASNTTRGCAAKFSVAQDDNTLFFLGNDRVVYRINGYSTERISTHAIETEFETYSVVDDAFAFILPENGHKFYTLTFPTSNKTFSFDIATGLWHERTTLEGGAPKRWRANCYENFSDKKLIGDFRNGKIYYVDSSVYTENSEYMERIAQGSVQWADNSRVTYDMVRLDMDAGVGLITGQGSDPQVMMSYSDDGGQTFSSELWRSFGKIGEFLKRAIWRRLGTARERIFKFKITDPVPVRITGAYADVRVGRP